MNDRLKKFDWIEHGLRTLASDGANALKVGPMATQLKVSRGSFYWHFRDIADFRSQVLQCWQERTTEQVIRNLEAAKAEPDRLKRLMRRAFVTKRSLERAIRSWASEDKEVAATSPPSIPAGSLTSQKCLSRQAWRADGRCLGLPSCIGHI